jgi:hypothetical protein
LRKDPRYGRKIIRNRAHVLPVAHDVEQIDRKIAARFGVDPSTVQRISRPFDASAVVVAA